MNDKIMSLGNLEDIARRLDGCHAIICVLSASAERTVTPAEALDGVGDLLNSIIRDFQTLTPPRTTAERPAGTPCSAAGRSRNMNKIFEQLKKDALYAQEVASNSLLYHVSGQASMAMRLGAITLEEELEIDDMTIWHIAYAGNPPPREKRTQTPEEEKGEAI